VFTDVADFIETNLGSNKIEMETLSGYILQSRSEIMSVRANKALFNAENQLGCF